MTTRGRRPAKDADDPWGLDSGLPEFQDHLMPTEFIESEAKLAPRAAAPARTPARTAAPASAASRTKAPEAEPEGDALTERLTKLATTLDLEKFQKAAMNIDELNNSSNGELLADVLEDGSEGFWARARAAK